MLCRTGHKADLEEGSQPCLVTNRLATVYGRTLLFTYRCFISDKIPYVRQFISSGLCAFWDSMPKRNHRSLVLVHSFPVAP